MNFKSEIKTIFNLDRSLNRGIIVKWNLNQNEVLLLGKKYFS